MIVMMKEKYWAQVKPDQTCGCLPTRRASFGTHVVNAIEYCCSCGGYVDAGADAARITAHEAATGAKQTPRIPAGRITTLNSLPGHEITESLGLVSALQSSSGFTAGAKGRTALGAVLTEFSQQALAVGANAVVGVHFATFGAAGGITSALGGDAVGVLMVGTAVVAEPLG